MLRAARFIVLGLVGAACGSGETPIGRTTASLVGDGYEIDAPIPESREFGNQISVALAADRQGALIVFSDETDWSDPFHFAVRIDEQGRPTGERREIDPIQNLASTGSGFVGVAPSGSPDPAGEPLVVRFVHPQGAGIEDVAIAQPWDGCSDDDCPAEIACDESGACVVLFASGSELRVAEVRRGLSYPPSHVVGTGTLPRGVVVPGEPGFAIFSTPDTGGDLSLQRVSAAGVLEGAAVLVSSNAGSRTVAAPVPEGFGVAWVTPSADPTSRTWNVAVIDGSGGQKNRQILSSAGVRSFDTRDHLLVLDDGLLLVPADSPSYRVALDGEATELDAEPVNGRVAVLPGGGLVVVSTAGPSWTLDRADVVAQPLDRELSPTGSSWWVSAAENSQMYAIALTRASAVIWLDNRSEVTRPYRALLDADGCAVEPATPLGSDDSTRPGIWRAASDGRSLLIVEYGSAGYTVQRLDVGGDEISPVLSLSLGTSPLHLVELPATGGYWLTTQERELIRFDEDGSVHRGPIPDELERADVVVASAVASHVLTLVAEFSSPPDVAGIPARWLCDAFSIDESSVEVTVSAVILGPDGTALSESRALGVAGGCSLGLLALPEGDGYVVSWLGTEGRNVVRLEGNGAMRGAPTVVPELDDAVQVVQTREGFVWLRRVTDYSSGTTELGIVTTDAEFRVTEQEILPSEGVRNAVLLPTESSAVVLVERLRRWPARVRIEAHRLDGETCATPTRAEGADAGTDSGVPEAGTETAATSDTGSRTSVGFRGGCGCRVAATTKAADGLVAMLLILYSVSSRRA